MEAIYVLAVVLGQALGYVIVRLFVWAFPSLWEMLYPDGRAQYRQIYHLIMDNNPSHLWWRAAFYAFRDVGEIGVVRRHAHRRAI